MLREDMSPRLADRLMGNPNQVIAAVRNQEVDATLFAFVVGALPGLAASLYRAKDVGWQPVMSFQIGLYLLVVGAAGLRRRLSFRARVFVVPVAFFSLGVSSVLTWGLIGPGILSFMACSIVATALFGSRSGILATILCAIVLTAVGIAVYLKKSPLG